MRQQKHKDAQYYVRELEFMRATATGKEGKRGSIVVCSEREEAGLAAAPVALRRLCLDAAAPGRDRDGAGAKASG